MSWMGRGPPSLSEITVGWLRVVRAATKQGEGTGIPATTTTRKRRVERCPKQRRARRRVCTRLLLAQRRRRGPGGARQSAARLSKQQTRHCNNGPDSRFLTIIVVASRRIIGAHGQAAEAGGVGLGSRSKPGSARASSWAAKPAPAPERRPHASGRAKNFSDGIMDKPSASPVPHRRYG